MEVYATIFMIFVSHVLSSFTSTLSSRHKDGKNIPELKMRRTNDFRNHFYINEENILDDVVGDDVRFENDARTKIPGLKTSSVFMHQTYSYDFVSSSENSNLIFIKKNKPRVTQNPTDKYSSKSNDCENKLINSHLNFESNNRVENSPIIRPRKKKINYFLPFNMRYDIFKNILKRLKKDSEKNTIMSDMLSLKTHELASSRIDISKKKRFFRLAKNLFGNNLASKINKVKTRSLKLINNEQNSNLGDFTYNVSDSGDWQFGVTGSVLDLDTINGPGIASNRTTISVSGTTPTVLRKLMQLRNTSPKKVISGKLKDEFNINVVLKNKDGLIDLNGDKTKSELESFPKSYCLISSQNNDTFKENPNVVYISKMANKKKIQPWDKFCPCLGGKLLKMSNETNRQPWVTACSRCVGTNEDNDLSTLLPDLYHISSIEPKPLESGLHIIHRFLEEDKHSDDLHTNKARPDTKTLLLIRVPIAGAEDYSGNGTWNSVLPFNNTSDFKHVKSRSVVDLFLPSFSKRSTIRPKVHVMKPWEEPWKFRQEFSIFSTSTSVTHVPDKNINNPVTTTNEPPFITKSLLEYIAETCPSCSKNRVDASFKTTNKDCDGIESNDHFCYKESIGNNSKCRQYPEEKSDHDLLSYFLKLPKTDLTNITSPPSQKIMSLKGLTILKSQDSPPKYFIEVPNLFNKGLKNIPEDVHSSSLSTVPITKKSKPRKDKIRNIGREKPIILFLQPFDINGNNVYLPMNDVDFARIGQPSESCTKHTVSYDHTEYTSYPRSKTVVDGFLDKNDSVLPFVLLPAYLAMHPQSQTTVRSLFETDSQPQVNEERKPLHFRVAGDSHAKSKAQDVALLLNNLLIEKKTNNVSKQPSSTLQMKAKDIVLTKKSPRKPFSGRSSTAPGMASFIILMNEMPDTSCTKGFEFPFNKGDFSFVDQNDAVTIEPLGNYIPI